MNHSQKDFESTHNPSPKKWIVPFYTKCLSLAFFCCALIGYGLFIAYRKSVQRAFIEQNRTVSFENMGLSSIKGYDVALGKEIELFEHHKNQWILLNIWATWCPTCINEMPELEALAQKMSGKLSVIALAADEALDPVNTFFIQTKPSFKVMWDSNKTTQQLFKIKKYPETFLISPDKRIVHQMSGPQKWSSAQISAILQGKIIEKGD